MTFSKYSQHTAKASIHIIRKTYFPMMKRRNLTHQADSQPMLRKARIFNAPPEVLKLIFVHSAAIVRHRQRCRFKQAFFLPRQAY